MIQAWSLWVTQPTNDVTLPYITTLSWTGLCDEDYSDPYNTISSFGLSVYLAEVFA